MGTLPAYRYIYAPQRQEEGIVRALEEVLQTVVSGQECAWNQSQVSGRGEECFSLLPLLCIPAPWFPARQVRGLGNVSLQ